MSGTCLSPSAGRSLKQLVSGVQSVAARSGARPITAGASEGTTTAAATTVSKPAGRQLDSAGSDPTCRTTTD